MAVSAKNLSIDIGVCTFRRPELADTLRSLDAMEMPAGFDIRIIVADNDDTPTASDLVTALSQ
ncbi:glycosyltransferase family 2 protein, partial [Mesorhizobium sp. M7D.F.Ca.US.004.01.2.1]